MRTGIFGGSFDPPHIGHRAALETFTATARLDTVLVIPTFVSPHKEHAVDRAPFDDRIEMCRLAFPKRIGRTKVEISDIEKRLWLADGEKNYTKKTLAALIGDRSGEFCLYVGTDMFLTFDRWVSADYLLKTAELYVCPRNVGELEAIEDFKRSLEERFETKGITVISAVPVVASSTDVRGGAHSLISPKVMKYVKKKGLYSL